MSTLTIMLNGRRFVVLPESEYRRLTRLQEQAKVGPRGYRPAVATMRLLLAQDIVAGRKKAGLTQAELAKRTGLRPETICRLEQGKHTPNVATVERIQRALDNAQKGAKP